MLLPIRTDSPVRRTPYVNYALISINILVYLLLDVVGRNAPFDAVRVKQMLMLWPANLEVSQFLTYQFLHADKWHLIGNMFFLWLFGNSVNAKMGDLSYALFYLAAGVFAGIGFAIGDSTAPCLGASGSIAGVTTAYLVLFPRSEVTVLYFMFIYVGTIQIGSMLWIIGKMVLWDNWFAMQLEGSAEFTSVAYSAHLAGYLFGFIYTLGMLSARALPRDTYDLLSVIRRWHQRRTFSVAMANPDAKAQLQYGRVTHRPTEMPAEVPTYTVANDPAGRLRQTISELVTLGDFSGAATQYVNLIAADPSQVLPRQNQLDVANQLMTLGRHPQAAEAYEKYLKHYPKAPNREQVKLVLGILYARYLLQYERARLHLGEALEILTDTNQRAQAAHWLEVAATGQPPPYTQPAV